MRRAHNLVLCRHSVQNEIPGKPQIRDQRLIPLEKDVCRLEVAMDDPVPVQAGQGFEQCSEDILYLLDLKNWVTLQQAEQGRPLDELVSNVGADARKIFEIENGDHTGMLDPTCQPGLTQESGYRFGIRERRRIQNLDRNLSLEAELDTEIDVTHPTGAQAVNHPKPVRQVRKYRVGIGHVASPGNLIAMNKGPGERIPRTPEFLDHEIPHAGPLLRGWGVHAAHARDRGSISPDTMTPVILSGILQKSEYHGPMSYDLGFWHCPDENIDPDTAGAIYELLCEEGPDESFAEHAQYIQPHPNLEKFLKALLKRYPPLEDLEEEDVDESPWSVTPEPRKWGVVLSLAHGDTLEDVTDFIIVELADKYALLGYDPQGEGEGTLCRPGASD